MLDNLNASNIINTVNFAGGEPLMHKDLSRLIKYSNELGFKVSVITNGFFVDDITIIIK